MDTLPARLVLTFADREARDEAARRLRAAEMVAVQSVRRGTEPARNWVAEVGKRDVAVPLGQRFAAVVGTAEALPGRTSIHVVRSQAFGTGEHASTRLAAALLEEAASRGGGVLDVGTGTGVLAVLALRAGSTRGVALDLDPGAAGIAVQTGRLNAIGRRLHVLCGTLRCLEPSLRFRTVVANIERDVLMEAMPLLARHTASGGRLILSGLLTAQADTVAGAARHRALLEVERLEDEGWVALSLVPRPGLHPCARVAPGAVRGGRVRLPRAEAHHLERVRRLAGGESVRVTDGIGGVWSGRLASTTAGLWVEGLEAERADTESHLEIVLLQGIIQLGGRMEALIRSVTELGAGRIVPVIAGRTQGGSRLGRKAAHLRWERVAIEAVKQCGRTTVPRIDRPTPFGDAVAEPFDGISLLLDPGGSGLPAFPDGARPRRVRLLVGPEGGLAPEEVRRAVEVGFQTWGLGPRTLRAETAATAGVSLIQAAWGDCRPQGEFA